MENLRELDESMTPFQAEEWAWEELNSYSIEKVQNLCITKKESRKIISTLEKEAENLSLEIKALKLEEEEYEANLASSKEDREKEMLHILILKHGVPERFVNPFHTNTINN